MRKFTAFNKLYIFSRVATSLSFSKAATELYITQAAVSQQIKSLEELLGFALFKRMNKKIMLTSKGQEVLHLIGDSYTNLQIGMHSIAEGEKTGVLNISTLPSFAMKWLIPRLSKFNEQYPDINIHIAASTKLTDFSSDNIDLVIRYGHQSESQLHAVHVLDEDIFLVANPQILKNKPILSPKDIKKHTLLYDEVDCFYEMYGVANEISWNSIASELSIDISKNRSLIFSEAHLVLQAAVSGQGVAIARSALVEDELASGTLVRVLPEYVVHSPGYSLVYPKTSEHHAKIQLFSDWFIAQASTSKSY